MAKRKKAAKKKKTKKKAAGKRRLKGLWSTSDLNLLKKLFPDTPTAKVAKKIGRKTDAVKKKASRMGLRKSKRYLKSI
ncbi:MAG: hypothetical protein MUO88_25020, partial [Desulfobacterales bacterium]|nr:hypothetical protein [Desulfobacterales bacterium]